MNNKINAENCIIYTLVKTAETKDKGSSKDIEESDQKSKV
jgi:hypothetical protein